MVIVPSKNFTFSAISYFKAAYAYYKAMSTGIEKVLSNGTNWDGF